MPSLTSGLDAGNFQYSWLIAVVIAVSASTISNFGMNLQKLAFTYREKKTVRRPVFVTMWVFGFVMIVSGALGDFAALGFGAQSIVAPLGSWTLVSNVVIAPLFLGEKLSRRDLFATLMIVAGCSLSVATASHKDEIYTADELFELYKRPVVGVYLGSVVFVVVAILLVVSHVERVKATRGPEAYEKWRYFHRFSYSCVAGLIGAQSVLFAKTAVELLTGTIANHERIFLADWRTYPVLAALATTLTGQVYYMQCGLARWDALYVVPIFQSFWILLSVVGGGVFYDEFDDFDALAASLFPIGIIFCIAGVYLLSQRDIESLRKPEESQAAAHESSPLISASGGNSPKVAGSFSNDEEEQRIRAGVQALQYAVCFDDIFLGIGLRRTIVKVVDAFHHEHWRIATAWVVSSLLHQPDGGPGAAQRSGKIAIGDMLENVDGESLLNRWLTHADAIRRISLNKRPLILAFRRIPQELRRTSWCELSEHDQITIARSGMFSLPARALGNLGNSLSTSLARIPAMFPMHAARPQAPSLPLQNRLSIGTELTDNTSSKISEDEKSRLLGAAVEQASLDTRPAQPLPLHEGRAALPPVASEIARLRSVSTGAAHETAADARARKRYRGATIVDVEDLLNVSSSQASKVARTAEQIGLQLDVATGSFATAPAPTAAETLPSEGHAQKYEFEVHVTNPNEALSASESIATAHNQLRHVTMDPFLSIFHMGGLIAPQAIAQEDKPDTHPLASLAMSVLPAELPSWDPLGGVIDQVDLWSTQRRERASTDVAGGAHSKPLLPFGNFK
jgi:uncharacterized membrane protein